MGGYQANCINCGHRKTNKGDYCSACAVGSTCPGCKERIYPGRGHVCGVTRCQTCGDIPYRGSCSCGLGQGSSETLDGPTRIEGQATPASRMASKHITSVNIHRLVEPVEYHGSDGFRQFMPGPERYEVTDQDNDPVPPDLHEAVLTIVDQAQTNGWAWENVSGALQKAIDKHNLKHRPLWHKALFPEKDQYPQRVLWWSS